MIYRVKAKGINRATDEASPAGKKGIADFFSSLFSGSGVDAISGAVKQVFGTIDNIVNKNNETIQLQSDDAKTGILAANSNLAYKNITTPIVMCVMLITAIGLIVLIKRKK